MRLILVKFDDGERFPVLVGCDGSPLFTPTVYTTTMLRSQAGSHETLVSKLRGLMVLYAWAEKAGFDIEQRFQRLQFLTTDEVEDLVAAANLFYRDLLVDKPAHVETKLRSRVLQFEKVRVRASRKEVRYVGPPTAALRLYAITDYLDWLGKEAWARAAHNRSQSDLQDRLGQMKKELLLRIPQTGRSATAMPREGLPPEIQRRLLEVINPSSPENPWKPAFVRARNEALIRLLVALGSRAGETLVLRRTDVDLGAMKLRIRRAPDEAEDPRVWKPNAKTLSRDLDFEDNLHGKLKDYILKHRVSIKGALKHPYLFVASGTGKPLSYAAVCKMFKVLRTKIPDLPSWFTAHICRYTWNDNFSAEMDERRVDPEEEMLLRCYLQGWVRTSQMPGKYTNRHIRRKAGEASLRMQKKLPVKKEPK